MKTQAIFNCFVGARGAAAGGYAVSIGRDCLVGREDLWDSGAAAGGFQSGFRLGSESFPRCGHVREFTYNYVNIHPEHPAPHDLLSSGGNEVCFATTPPDMEASCKASQQSGYATRYSFSAKEKDDETQYSYFGARYYDSDLSVWLSVDPMSDKYPHQSPYMYCSGSPVMLIDPDGRDNITFMDDGSIKREKTNDKFDMLLNQKGDMSQRIDFKDDKSQIGDLQSIDINGKKTQYMTIADDDVATAVFEFAASTTFNSSSHAEFGLQKFSFNDGFSMNVVQSGEIATNVNPNVTPLGQIGGIDLGGGHLIGNASSWDLDIHSHPTKGVLSPSGFERRLNEKTGISTLTPDNAVISDRTFENNMIPGFNPAASYVYGWDQNVNGPEYIKYNSENAKIVGRNR